MIQNVKMAPPLRPAQYVENILVTAILDGTYPTGAALPSERSLAEQIGVTRPTVRETLQRLAKEGWVKIHHGKSTVVNNYWQQGGLSLLSTLAKYGEYLPNGFVDHLLEVRATLVPTVARLAAVHHPQAILDYLRRARKIPQEAWAYGDYDWQLQMQMAKYSDNPIFPLILNDFASIFGAMALRYFSQKKARQASQSYYRELTGALTRSAQAVEVVAKQAMEQSIVIWQAIKSI
ncbi:MAG: fatty acid metabolism transcriptional regulator FadR [Desulfobacterales bacterium]|nr:MAG: fatty acid metabolism transcriptional regulator FadR [Desulfobacterales bacterium]